MSNFNDKQIQILQIAEKLFAEKGYDGTSIRDIAKEAQINIAMISYYFGSKEKLLESIILFRTTDLKVQLENVFEEELSPLQKIEKFIELYLEKINCYRGMYQILHFEIASNKRAMDLKAFTTVKRANLETLKKIIVEGQSQNIFKKDIVIELITPIILGTYFHFNTNRPFFSEILELNTDEKFNLYIKNNLTKHIKQTIKSLLINEK